MNDLMGLFFTLIHACEILPAEVVLEREKDPVRESFQCPIYLYGECHLENALMQRTLGNILYVPISTMIIKWGELEIRAIT